MALNRRREMMRATIVAIIGCALFAGGAQAQLREVHQIIYGMD